LLAGAAILVVSVIALIGWMLLDSYRMVRLHTIQSAQNVASALEHDIARNLELYDLSLLAVVEGLRLPEIDTVSPEIRNGVLFDGAATAEYLGSLFVVDETGRVRMDSRAPAPPNTNVAQQEFFRVHQQGDAGLHISGPLKDPSTGDWQIILSRRLEHGDGGFAGVVFVGLRLDFFKQLFAAIDDGPGGAISLLSSTGRLVYRHPDSAPPTGRTHAGSGSLPGNSQSRAGSFEAVSPYDGVDRFYAFQRVGNFPLLLTIGIARETAFAEWNRKALAAVGAMVGLIAAIGILGTALVAELRRRGRAEQSALESAQRYQILAEHSFDMIVRFDPRNQRRTYVSPSCRRLYGYEPQEAVAVAATEIIHPDDLPAVRAAVERVERGEQMPVTYRGRRKDGSYIWVEATLMPLKDPATGLTDIVSVVRDISERVRDAEALQAAKEQADAANRAKSEFLGTMSHELRTPLNAIIGFSEMLQMEVWGPIGQEQYRSYASDINSSASHLLALINDILDLTRAESGKMELHEEVFDVAAAIQSVVRLCGPRIEQAKLAVDVDLPADLPLLRADEQKTRQVLFNLIGNAVKFTPPDGRIEIAARFDPQDGLAITVSDSGIGIAAENLERVLEPFAQVDSSLSRSHSGTGLGLPIVKRMMELHQGNLSLTSSIGSGTIATVRFPIARAVHEQPQRAPLLTA